jgi:twitching motility two-component system response regulator PilH
MGMLLLVMDDDPDQRRLLERVLGAAGHRVVTAADGRSGTEATKALRPDAVILDVLMPGLNGYQTCRAIRLDRATAQVPVIIPTSKDEPTDALWAEEVGANTFLPKPADVPALLRAVPDLTGTA